MFMHLSVVPMWAPEIANGTAIEPARTAIHMKANNAVATLLLRNTARTLKKNNNDVAGVATAKQHPNAI